MSPLNDTQQLQLRARLDVAANNGDDSAVLVPLVPYVVAAATNPQGEVKEPVEQILPFIYKPATLHLVIEFLARILAGPHSPTRLYMHQ